MADINDWNVSANSNNSAPPNGWPEGMNPSAVNDTAREGMAVVARWNKDINGSVAVAGTDTYTATINATTGFALYDGYMFCGTFANANTGAATLNLTVVATPLGAKAIVAPDGSALTGGEIPAGAKVSFKYDGTSFRMDATLTSGGVTPDSTDTFTNKTFDANGTGNSITNIDVSDLSSGVDGELITWDATGLPSTVPVGSLGQVLTSNGAGAAPTFQGAVNNVVKIQTQTLTTSVVSIDFTTLDFSIYDHFILVARGFRAVAGGSAALRFSTNNGSSWITTSTYNFETLDGASANNLVQGQGLLSANSQSTSNDNSFFEIIIQQRTSGDTSYVSKGYHTIASGADNLSSAAGCLVGTTGVNAVQIINSGGNTQAANGTFTLYGVV